MLEVKVANSLVRKNLINKEEVEIYQYGLEVFFLKVTHIVCVLLVGFVFQKLIEIASFLILFSLLRSTLSGYHSKTKNACVMISLLISIGLIIVISLPSKFYERNIFGFLYVILYITYLGLIANSVNRKRFTFSLVVVLLAYLISQVAMFNYLKITVIYALGITILLYLIKKVVNNE